MATSERLSPQVQRLQTSSPYVDIYTRALPNPLHPEPKRWQSPGGWGARHMNDTAPFTLWDEQNSKFRHPTQEESAWIRDKYGDGKRGQSGWPPQPVPLTLGCMPVYFVGTGTGESHFEALPRAPYPNPRVLDPYPAALRWPKMQFPTKEQRVAMRAILYLPNWTIVELTHGDGRNYEPKSLPGVVAGRTTLYHHDKEPFYMAMKDKGRVALLQGNQIDQGTWSEIDGMSSGLITVMAYGTMDMRPPRHPGHPPIEFRNWRSYTISSLFGVINNSISEGMCGAPVVNCDSGGGFFHLFDGTNCLTAHLDDLVAEGWQVL
ncbi:hypothetical protein N7486_006672 [Penicillium sp. IBT 16267x]|nr:hypothetical protein N7486_006672 [Penicillium sp. IBT 16267x]